MRDLFVPLCRGWRPRVPRLDAAWRFAVLSTVVTLRKLRPRALGACVIAAALAFGRAAVAQETSPPGASDGVPATEEQALPPMQLTACRAEPMYQRAFTLAGVGRFDEAAALLMRVGRACPSHPYAAELLRLVRAQSVRAEMLEGLSMSSGDRATRTPSTPALTAPEAPTGLARGELVGVQAAIGLIHGGLFCPFFVSASGGGSCGPAGVVAPMFVGAALGAGISVVASWDGLRSGQGMVVESGSFWGSYNGFLVAVVATNGLSFGTGVAAGVLFETGFALGLGAGVLTAVLARPRAGHVGFLNSGGLWGGAMGLSAWIMSLGNGSNGAGFAASQLVGVNVGLLAAGIAGAFYPTSRGRMLLVDLGTLLGGAVGAGTGTLLAVAAGSSYYLVGPLIGGLSMAGIVAGFVTTMAITHRIDYPAPSPRVRSSFAPVGPEGRPGLSFGLTF